MFVCQSIDVRLELFFGLMILTPSVCLIKNVLLCGLISFCLLQRLLLCVAGTSWASSDASVTAACLQKALQCAS